MNSYYFYLYCGECKILQDPALPEKVFSAGVLRLGPIQWFVKCFSLGLPLLHHFVLFTLRDDLLSLPLEIIHSQAIYLIENNPAKRRMIYNSLPFKSIKFVAK